MFWHLTRNMIKKDVSQEVPLRQMVSMCLYTQVSQVLNFDGSEQERQNQCIAFGDGLNYVKHENNPVVTGDMLPKTAAESISVTLKYGKRMTHIIL